MTTTAEALLIFGGLVGPSIAAAALAGAVALGIGALALSRRRKGGSKGISLKGSGGKGGGGYGHHGHSSSHGGHSGGHGHDDDGGYGHRRKKRATVGSERERGDRLMQMIRQQDTTSCGLKMVCQLGSLPEHQLAAEELAVLDLVRLVPPGQDAFVAGPGTRDYHAALHTGAEGGNCSHAYPTCPIDGVNIMDAVMAFLP